MRPVPASRAGRVALLVTDWKREGEDDHEEALAFDPSVPADMSEAAYDAVGLLSPPPRVFGLPRALMHRCVHSSPILLRGRFAR